MEKNMDAAPATESCCLIDKEKQEHELVISETRADRLVALQGMASLKPTSTLKGEGTNVLGVKEVGGDTTIGNDGAKSVETDQGDIAKKLVNSQRPIMSALQHVPASEDIRGKGSNTKGGEDKSECLGEAGIKAEKSDESEVTNEATSSQQPIAPSLGTVSVSEKLKRKALDSKEPQSNDTDSQQDWVKRTKLDEVDIKNDAANNQQPIMTSPGTTSLSKGLNAKPLSTEDAVSKKADMLNLTDSIQNLVIEEDKSTIVGVGVGLGRFKRGAIKNKYGQFNSSRLSSIRKARIPSWTAPAATPEAKIDESILQILSFMKSASEQQDDSPGADQDGQFKAFLGANKEIVRWWRVLEGGKFRGRPKTTMAENVDCIHAILVAWSDDTDTCGSWVSQAMELTELCLAFARGWEALTGKKLGVPEWFDMNNDTNKTPEGGTVAEIDENMEYIHPKSIDMNKDNGLAKTGCHVQVGSTISTPQETTSPQKRQLSQTTSTQQKTSSEPIDSSTTHFRAYAPSATREEISHLHRRLSKIEDLLINQHTTEQTIIRVLEMQQLMIQDITDAIFGDITKPNPLDSEERNMAKRTGLLMMNKSLADNKVTKISALEEENNKLKIEIEKLKAARQAEDSNAEQEVQKLKQVVGVLCAHLPMESESKDEKTWTDEAWDGAMEMYWPQGDPTQTGGSGLGAEDMPMIYQAGRGQAGGSGIGSCAIM
ncbi:uncharacterized protein BP5553_08251 [Venustampulla echinocandica]|uniref:Uncharacterized protein n=1 Tax=Venustampulla echinocandica TaxID=2656787 RepID=A0A370TG66_9HELO|nr:uncharacterized protein BP5553_08251 [Venustampulla echinocandica]RDL33883.1 hypothetical protein BP5553_08251 [Venustampulla echinocandica]